MEVHCILSLACTLKLYSHVVLSCCTPILYCHVVLPYCTVMLYSDVASYARDTFVQKLWHPDSKIQ